MICWLLGAVTGLALGSAAGADVPQANPAAVEEVRSGKRKVANAAWWGFDSANATAAIQGAIGSGARKVIVPNVGREWIVDPLFLSSDQEIVFENGVVVAARKGGFTDLNDCLFKARSKRNVVMRGYGATLRMNKPDYTKGEWRHCLELDSCTNVKILGLTLRDSGGDGIYIGNADPKQPFCQDVLVRDCVLDNNRRQGMSVITAVKLRVERCSFRNTSGTAPRAGVDLEPNGPEEKLVDCAFRDCTMENNDGAGILIYMGQLNQSTEPLSVRFERCRITSERGSGIELGGTLRTAPSGLISFTNCTVENCSGPGLNLFNKASEAVSTRFERCSWRSVARANPSAPPLQLQGWRGPSDPAVGGLEFVDCSVQDDRDRPVLGVSVTTRPAGVRGLRGTITVVNARGAHTLLGTDAADITLRIRQRK